MKLYTFPKRLKLCKLMRRKFTAIWNKSKHNKNLAIPEEGNSILFRNSCNFASWCDETSQQFEISQNTTSLLLSTALQLLVQSFVLLNHLLPSSSILYKGLPIWHFQLLYIFFNIILPAYLCSSRWRPWNGFPGLYCFDHSCFLHSFVMTIPS